jgi:hypothetical protein
MSPLIVKFFSRGMLLIVLSILMPVSLWALPVCLGSPGPDSLYQVSGEGPAPLAADTCSCPWEFSLPSGPESGLLENTLNPPVDLAGLTAPESAPPAVTLLVIGAAMIWLAGVIRYNPAFQS